jgi:phosphatidylserine decarboxylase
VFAPGAGRMIGPPAAIAVVLGILLIGSSPHGGALAGLALAILAAIGLAVFFAVFFRDPERVPGEGIVSAADGRIRAVDTVDGRIRISVFMNVTDVHVNRLPFDGRVEEISDTGSGFRAAYLPDAEHNVQRRYRLASSIGPIEIVQITGVVARRLVAFVAPGSSGRKGDRFGMIVLGSRVDVLLPADHVELLVKVGDRVHAGATSIARVRP